MNADKNADARAEKDEGLSVDTRAEEDGGLSVDTRAEKDEGLSADTRVEKDRGLSVDTSASVMEKILEYKVVAILRGLRAEEALPVAEALLAGGIRLLEIPFNQRGAAPGQEAPAIISLLKQRFGSELCLGAGTALTPEQVDLAADAGAEFILSPGTSAAVITRTKERGLVSVPGAATASEMAEAYQCGADIVKLFPAGDLGIGYLKSVLAPLNHIPVMAVGGVDEHNLQEWMRAGASAVGVGARLVQETWVKEGRYDELTALAAEYVSEAGGMCQ